MQDLVEIIDKAYRSLGKRERENELDEEPEENTELPSKFIKPS